MIWFDLKGLERKISNNDLTEKDGFDYLMATMILSSIFVGGGLREDSYSWFIFLNVIIAVGITVWGMNACYKVNNELDGKDFLKRYLAISWVVGMRLILWVFGLSLVIFIIIEIVMAANGTTDEVAKPVKDVIILVFIALSSLICYLLMINSFKSLKVKAE
jgi:hypothetical protein